MAVKTRQKDGILTRGDAELEQPTRGGHMIVVNPGGDPQLPAESEPEEKPTAPDGSISDIDELEQDDLQADIRRVLSELDEDAGRASIRVYRVGPGGPRDLSFIDEISFSEYSVKFLADNYGGGIFNVKVYVPKYDADEVQQGVKMVCNKRVKIEGLPRIPKRDTDEPVSPASGASDLLTLGKIMTDGFQSLGRLIVEREKPKSTVEMAQELLALKSLFVDNREPTDPFKMVERLAGVMNQLRPPAEGESSAMTEMVRLFGPVVRDSIVNRPAETAQPDTAAIPETLPQPVPGAPASAPTQSEDDMSPQDLIYKGYVKLLVAQARSQNPTKPIAAQIYDSAPPEFVQQVVTDPQFFTKLARYDSGVMLFPQWFQQLQRDIKELSDADEREPNTDE